MHPKAEIKIINMRLSYILVFITFTLNLEMYYITDCFLVYTEIYISYGIQKTT